MVSFSIRNIYGSITKRKNPDKTIAFRGFLLEAPSRFELEIKVLQPSALPLGYGAAFRMPAFRHAI